MPDELDNTPPREAEASGQSGGFPTDTPLAEMTPEQQAAYWRDKARKHETRVKKQADYSDLRKKAEEYDKLVEANASETEKAVKAAFEEGRRAALEDANRQTVEAIFRANLKARGMKSSEIDDFIAETNINAFIKDGEVDTDRIASRSTAVAGKPRDNSPSPQEEYPDMGQGSSGNAPKVSAREAARADLISAGRIKAAS